MPNYRNLSDCTTIILINVIRRGEGREEADSVGWLHQRNDSAKKQVWAYLLLLQYGWEKRKQKRSGVRKKRVKWMNHFHLVHVYTNVCACVTIIASCKKTRKKRLVGRTSKRWPVPRATPSWATKGAIHMQVICVSNDMRTQYILVLLYLLVLFMIKCLGEETEQQPRGRQSKKEQKNLTTVLYILTLRILYPDHLYESTSLWKKKNDCFLHDFEAVSFLGQFCTLNSNIRTWGQIASCLCWAASVHKNVHRNVYKTRIFLHGRVPRGYLLSASTARKAQQRGQPKADRITLASSSLSPSCCL